MLEDFGTIVFVLFLLALTGGAGACVVAGAPVENVLEVFLALGIGPFCYVLFRVLGRRAPPAAK